MPEPEIGVVDVVADAAGSGRFCVFALPARPGPAVARRQVIGLPPDGVVLAANAGLRDAGHPRRVIALGESSSTSRSSDTTVPEWAEVPEYDEPRSRPASRATSHWLAEAVAMHIEPMKDAARMLLSGVLLGGPAATSSRRSDRPVTPAAVRREARRRRPAGRRCAGVARACRHRMRAPRSFRCIRRVATEAARRRRGGPCVAHGWSFIDAIQWWGPDDDEVARAGGSEHQAVVLDAGSGRPYPFERTGRSLPGRVHGAAGRALAPAPAQRMVDRAAARGLEADIGWEFECIVLEG